ncbi:unnamed protein product [Closterium sp. Naga37s-1]|nr:unnamed protein product [Closterium sp. Naga37s-1]
MTIAEFLNGEEGGVEMLVGERKRRAIRDPEGWGIDEAREELRKKLADGGGGEEARGSRFVRGKARISSLPTSYNVVDQLKLTPVSASVWNYIKDSDKDRKELLEALKKGDEENEEGAAAMQGVAKVVAAAPVEAKGKEKEAPRASNLFFQIPQCDVYLGKHRVTAIVDSGASQTALSHVIARKLGLLPYIQDTTIEFTTSSGETSKPWGVLPDVLVRVGKLTLPVDIAVTGANTYDMLLGQDWIYSANADILTSKGKIVYQVNTTETDSVPITTGPLGGGGRPSYVLLPSHTTHRNINEEDEERIKEWMEEQDFLKWTEERRVAMAEEEGGMELNAEEEDEYYLWLREQDEEGDKEEASSEEEEEEEKELKVVDGEEEAWGYDFGSPTAEEVGAWESAGLGIDWDKEYDEMVEKYVGEVNEAKWEGDSMVDGEEYLDYEWEEGELVYDKRRKPISTDHFFEMYSYPAAEKWNYVAVESGDEGRIILGSYYTLKKEVPRVACPAFEDLPVSLNHELDKQQQKEVRTLLVEYKEVFSTEKETLGTHPTIRHHIATGSAKPIAHKPYPIPMYISLFPNNQEDDEEESSESVTKGEMEKGDEEEESTEENGGEEEESFEEGQRPDEGIEEEQLLEEIGQPKKKAKVEGEEGEEETPSKNLASETALDIWDDTNTLFFLEKGVVDPALSTVEKRRVRARGKNFEWRDGRLLKKIKGELKPVPRKEERRDIIAFLHGLGHLGVPRTTDLVKKQYDWASIHSSTKFSPFFLQYGRHPNITRTTMSEFEARELSELSTEEEADAVAGYLYRRSSDMELVLAQAVGNHDRPQEKQKLDFDLRRTTALEMEKLVKGDFVRIKPSKRVAWEKQANKFKTLFRVKEVEQFDVVLEDKAGASWKESRENVKLVKFVL